MQTTTPSPFLFATSQVGAEPILKAEISRQFPEARLAFSRPGLVTFKLVGTDENALDELRLKSVFARTWGFSIGTVRGKSDDAMIPQVWKLVEAQRQLGRKFDRIHVFGRDLYKIGDYKFEPRLTEEVNALCWRLCQEYPNDFEPLWRSGQDLPANEGDRVLDCVVLNPLPPHASAEFLAKREKAGKTPPREWLIGWHRVHSYASALPGGMLDLEMGSEIASRAWLKMEEALRWSNLPIQEDARVCEIGSAPGGATQALLARGCEVLGVDPAEMAPEVLANPKFRHLRMRIASVRRKEFRKIRWLTCDINVPPNYTLDVIESIVMHPDVQIRGMLLTLKFPDWNMGFEVDDYLGRIRSWGFNRVKARQLHYSHQEICVSCLKKPFKR